MLKIKYIVPAGYSNRPRQRASVAKLMEVMKSSGDAYVDKNGEYIDPCGQVSKIRILETKDKFQKIIKQLKEEKRTHMPLVVFNGHAPRVTDGRHRIAALESLGIPHVYVLADNGMKDGDIDKLWHVIRYRFIYEFFGNIMNILLRK